MKEHNEAFYEQIAYLLKQYRDGHIRSIPDLMQFIQMTYGDYIEFHPDCGKETLTECLMSPLPGDKEDSRQPKGLPS